MKAPAFLWQFLPPLKPLHRAVLRLSQDTSLVDGIAGLENRFRALMWPWLKTKCELCMIGIHRMKNNCFWTHSIPNCGLTWLSLLFTVSQMNMFKTFVDWWLHGVILSNILGIVTIHCGESYEPHLGFWRQLKSDPQQRILPILDTSICVWFSPIFSHFFGASCSNCSSKPPPLTQDPIDLDRWQQRS